MNLHEKYAEGGYLCLWFENSPNIVRLNALREIIRNESHLREKFEYLYDTLTNLHTLLQNEDISLKANGYADMEKYGWNPLKEFEE